MSTASKNFNKDVNMFLEEAREIIRTKKNDHVSVIPMIVKLLGDENVSDKYIYTRGVIYKACEKLAKSKDYYSTYIAYNKQDEEFIVYISKSSAFTDVIEELFEYKDDMDPFVIQTIMYKLYGYSDEEINERNGSYDGTVTIYDETDDEDDDWVE